VERCSEMHSNNALIILQITLSSHMKKWSEDMGLLQAVFQGLKLFSWCIEGRLIFILIFSGIISASGFHIHFYYILGGSESLPLIPSRSNTEVPKMRFLHSPRYEFGSSDGEAKFPYPWRRSRLLEDLFPPYQTFSRTYSLLHTLSLYIYNLTVSATK